MASTAFTTGSASMAMPQGERSRGNALPPGCGAACAQASDGRANATEARVQ